MTLQYYTREHFGVARMYLADELQAKAFYALTQRKIILPEHVEALKALGITLEKVERPIEAKL